MKTFITILFLSVCFACNNNSSSKTTTDSSSINTSTGNVSDGGPNNGIGDTSRMNDMVKDSSVRDTPPKK